MTIPKERVKAQLVHTNPETLERTIIFTGFVIATSNGYITNETLPTRIHPISEYQWERVLDSRGTPILMKCPHCESENIDAGFTGLNMCNECGGLNRDGEILSNVIQEKPLLGLATTRELLEEIKTRGEMSAYHARGYQEEIDMAIGAANLLDTLPGSVLDYRTVDGDNEPDKS